MIVPRRGPVHSDRRNEMMGFFEGFNKGCGCAIGAVVGLVIALIVIGWLFGGFPVSL